MFWTKIISILFGLLDKALKRANRKQLIDLGKAEQARKNLKRENENIKKAINARSDARNSGVPDDYEHYRD